jgi:hypothetical protein
MPHNLLTQIENNIQKLTAQGLRSLVVFDLDSTLFDVSPRLERILMDFAQKEEFLLKFPDQIAFFKNIKVLPTDWGIKAALVRAGLQEHFLDFQAEVTAFWLEHFFSNHYLQYDRPIDGAIEFVQSVAQAGADIAYLTGRDVARMGLGSEQILKKWGLPLNENSQLNLKPHKSMDDAEFKTDWFVEALSKSYQKIYFFENEPVILHRMAEKCPEVECIFLDSTHSGKAHPPENLPRLINFLKNRHPNHLKK